MYPGAKLPTKGTPDAAGWDLYAHWELGPDIRVVPPRGWLLIPNGIAIAMPSGMEAQVRARSGLALKHGIGLMNGIGTIDADYRGELAAILMNHTDTPFVVEKGMRVAQLVFASLVPMKFVQVTELPMDTQRGTGGYGSTGV